jgi:hypothetical protein
MFYFDLSHAFHEEPMQRIMYIHGPTGSQHQSLRPARRRFGHSELDSIF